MASSYLSKSRFIRGLQCHKSLWLLNYKPELRTPPDQSQQAIFDMGTEVGLVAQQLYPDGETIEFDENNLDGMVDKTKEHIASGVNTIYEATFKYDDVLVMIDIMNRAPDGWELYEVKSSTTVKDVHINDVAVQYYVLTGTGLRLSSASLVHINNQYIRRGILELGRLFSIVDLTERVIEKHIFVKNELELMRDAIKGDVPQIDIGPHCNEPHDCDFRNHCWSHVPDNSIFDLSGLNNTKKFNLYNKGILDFKALPEGFPLSSSQELQVKAVLTGERVVNQEGIKAFLDELYYPLYFLDFETFAPPIPPFDNLRPYQKIPFQYSLHYLEKEGGDLKHKEILAEEEADPREALARSITENIPEGACVLAYNSGFEKSVIQELAEQFPQYSTQLLNINNRILDLMMPFQNKYLYTKEMRGRYSIKSVLPALVPELGYDRLEIPDGNVASKAYSALHMIEDKEEVKKIRHNLLEYCKQDTLGMVKLVEQLVSEIRGKNG